MPSRLFIIDYGMGNLRSVRNALRFLGRNAAISSDPRDLETADAFVLPGVGAFGEAMRNLERSGMVGLLREQVLEEGKPLLGICLGMQLLAEDSEEKGHHRGLGWIGGHVARLSVPSPLRLPHVGWNEIEIVEREPMFRNVAVPDFYFDHSYHFATDDESIVTARCAYGEHIVAAIRTGNVFATQFHPEKSQVNGLKLLRNFINAVESGVGLAAPKLAGAPAPVAGA